jgi:type IV pilus assembly protein PilW
MKARARGFTLIEMMISMALFGLIAAGAMALVMAGTRSQAHSSRVDVAQSALRAGIDFITRDVMMASAGASTGLITRANGTAVNAVDFSTTNNNTNNNATTSTDKLDLYLVDGTVSAESVAAVAGGATSLAVTYEQSPLSGVFSVASHPFVQVSDLKTAVVVPLTGVTNVGTTSATLTVGAIPTGVSFSSNNAYVLPSRHVVYEISKTVFAAQNANLNTSMLTMTVNGVGPQPLAEGVEDMQIAYGFDTNGDGLVTEVTPGGSADDDEWLYNKSGDTVLAAMTIDKLRSIRITLVAKSTSIDSGATFNTIPAYEDHAQITGDGFIRRVLRTEITVRNFNL